MELMAKPQMTASQASPTQVGDYRDCQTSPTTLAQVMTLAPPDAAREQKLLKHRQSMARLRSEWRERNRRLEELELSLHDKLECLLDRMERRRVAHEAHECRSLAYAELVRSAQSLMEQRYALEEELLVWSKYVKLVAAETQRMSSSVSETVGYWVRSHHGDDPFFVDVSSAEAMSRAVNTAQWRLDDNQAILTQNAARLHVHSCRDWQVERMVTRDAATQRPILRFRYTRDVPSTSVEELEEKTWQMLHIQEQLQFVHGAGSKIVQQGTHDALVLLCDAPATRSRLHGLHVQQVSHPDSATVIMLVVDKASQLTTHGGQSVEWIRSGATRLMFSRVADGRPDLVRVEWSGALDMLDEEQAAAWMVQTCAMVMRWELAVLPTRLVE